jgi:hypothetical protein
MVLMVLIHHTGIGTRARELLTVLLFHHAFIGTTAHELPMICRGVNLGEAQGIACPLRLAP